MINLKYFCWLVISALIARVTILNRVRSTDEFASVDVSAAFEVLLLGVGVVGVLASTSVNRTVRWVVSTPIIFLFSYYFLCAISSFWSIDPLYSLVRSTEILCLILICQAVITCTNSKDLEKTLPRFMMLFIVMYLAMHIKNNGITLSIRAYHTNSYSAIAAAGAIYCYALFNTGRQWVNKYFYAFLAFLILGTSSASLISAVFGFLIVNILSGSKSAAYFVVLLIFGIIFNEIFDLEEFLFSIIFPGKSVDQITSLRGRAELWAIYWDVFNSSPFIGKGFAVVSRVAESFGGINQTNTHNGYFESFLGVGIIGSSVFYFWFFKHILLFSKFRRVKEPSRSIALFSASLVLLVNNGSKSIVGGGFDPVFVVFLLIVIYLYRDIRWSR